MIIDSLTHVTPDGRWFSTSYDASETRLLREMDGSGVEKAVVVALAGYIENSFVAGLCVRHSDRLIPGASVNPGAYSNRKRAVAELRKVLSEGCYAVLKLHPRFNRYDPLDPRCWAILEEMAGSDSPLPIWLDTYFPSAGNLLKKPPAETVLELVRGFPSLIFVLLHSCGPKIMELVPFIRDCPRAFLDISYTMHRFRSALEKNWENLLGLFPERLIFGSDFPEVSLSEALADFDSLSSGLAADTRDQVMGGNLQRILGW